jgi:CBS domain-containing protein
MQVRDVMTQNVISIAANQTILKAARLMLQNDISGLPVVDAQGVLVGMVTEGDFLRRDELGTERRRPKWLEFLLGPGRIAEEYVRASGRKVEDVMTCDPVTVAEDDTLETAVELMERRPLWSALRAAPRAHAGGDSAIRERMLEAFARQPWAPQVNVVVKNAVAELWGTITDERERQACIVTAENVAGVREVHDHLVWVEPMSGMAFPSPEEEAKHGTVAA